MLKSYFGAEIHIHFWVMPLLKIICVTFTMLISVY